VVEAVAISKDSAMQAEAARDRYRDALSELAASLQTGLREEQAPFEMNSGSAESDAHQHLAAAAFHLRPVLGPQQTNLLVGAIRRYVSHASEFGFPSRDVAYRLGHSADAAGLDRVRLAELCLLWEYLFRERRRRSWRTRRCRIFARAKLQGRRF
jgi:hypothetical protein